MKYLEMGEAPKMCMDSKSDRVKLTLKYMKKGHDFWSSVIFSDEKRSCVD